MTFKQLEYFVTLAQTLNFTRAAEMMQLAQPTLSRQISMLEEELGCRLFFRNRATTKLTEAGAHLVAYAQSIIESHAEMENAARMAVSGRTGKLRIGHLEGSTQGLIADIIGGFAAEYDSVDIELVECLDTGLANKLEQGEIDLAIGTPAWSGSSPTLRRIVIATVPMCLVVQKEHPYASRREILFDDLRDEPLLVISPETSMAGNSALYQACLSHGFSPNITHQASSTSNMFAYILCRMGSGVMPQPLESSAPSDLVFIPISDMEYFDQTFVWKSGNSNPCAAQFAEFVEQYIKLK